MWHHRHGADGGTAEVANFSEMEQRAMEFVHGLFEDAAAHEPQVDATVGVALTAAGAPAEIAQAAQGLVGLLLNHFTAESQAKAAAEAAAAAQPAA